MAFWASLFNSWGQLTPSSQPMPPLTKPHQLTDCAPHTSQVLFPGQDVSLNCGDTSCLPEWWLGRCAFFVNLHMIHCTKEETHICYTTRMRPPEGNVVPGRKIVSHTCFQVLPCSTMPVAPSNMIQLYWVLGACLLSIR